MRNFKTVAFLLCFLGIFSLCGCTSTESEESLSGNLNAAARRQYDKYADSLTYDNYGLQSDYYQYYDGYKYAKVNDPAYYGDMAPDTSAQRIASVDSYPSGVPEPAPISS